MGQFLRRIGAILALGGTAVFGARALGENRDRVDDDDEIDLVATLATRRLRSVSQTFMGGTVTVILGSADLDLRQTEAGPTGAEVSVEGLAGLVRVTIPSHWRRTVTSKGWLSAVTDSSYTVDDPDAPVLHISCALNVGRLIIDSRPQLKAVS